MYIRFFLRSLSLSITIGLLLDPVSSKACSCRDVPRSAEAKMDASGVVFLGKVEEVKIIGDKNFSGAETVTNLEVLNSWKGIGGRKSVNVHSRRKSQSCGYEFKEGQSYLIYAGESDDVIRTGYCKGNQQQASAYHEMQALDEYVSTGSHMIPKCYSKEEMAKADKKGVRGKIIDIGRITPPEGTAYKGLLKLQVHEMWRDEEIGEVIEVLVRPESQLSILNSNVRKNTHLYLDKKINFEEREVYTQLGCGSL